ncbi:MAG: universal stress protein [Planctomycetes bacterium]|nr:universal stress protein [Planctomycetota bacterium]
MNVPQRIVVGLDLDPKGCIPTQGSTAAAETALWLARTTSAHVTLLHSVARDEYYDPVTSELVPVCDTLTPQARLAVAEIIARFRKENAQCETIDSAERPSLALTREVQRQHAQLVILGKHDGRESDATRIGPIAMRVLRECPTPVWVVVPGRATIPKRILAATDLTQVGDEAVRWAAAIADVARAELHVVHIHPPTLHSRRADSDSHLRKLRETAVAGLSPQQREKAQVHVREAAPAQGLLTMVEELDSDLVVLGAFSHPRNPPHQVGTTAERLFARLETSVFVVKPN